VLRHAAPVAFRDGSAAEGLVAFPKQSVTEGSAMSTIPASLSLPLISTVDTPRRGRLQRSIAMLTAAAMLTACVSTREGRIGADDGTDACRAQVVALDSTGNFFGEEMIRGAAIGAVGGAALGALLAAASGGRGRNIAAGAAIGAVGGAVVGGTAGYFSARQQQAQDQASLSTAVANDLAAENAQLDRTWIAYTQLMDCRFGTAQRIREAFRAGQLQRPQAEAQLAGVRARTQRDLALARSINDKIGERGQQFDVAIENIAPGTKDQVMSGARVSRAVPVQARSSVALKLRPDTNAPEVTQISAREAVTLRPAANGFTMVETASGVRGYAPASAFPEARNLGAAPPPPSANTSTDFRSLAASNIARRDNFSQSLDNTERLAQGAGFELAS
jgi:outer membrane lipoprotein SlyB